MLKKSLIIKTDAKANENQIKIIDDIRITYLTSRLIRVEAGTFTGIFKSANLMSKKSKTKYL